MKKHKGRKGGQEVACATMCSIMAEADLADGGSRLKEFMGKAPDAVFYLMLPYFVEARKIRPDVNPPHQATVLNAFFVELGRRCSEVWPIK